MIGILRSNTFDRHFQTEQKFNVVCVTKRDATDNVAHFHLDVTGEAVAKHVLFARPGINIHLTVVAFQGKDYEIHHVRSGLNGLALVIGVRNEEEKPYRFWELYTDTPFVGTDHTGATVTSEEIQRLALQEICDKAYRMRR